MANFGVPREFISHHDRLLCVSFFLNLVSCTRIALEQICFQRGKLTVDCGQVLQVHISQMDLISVQCLEALFVWSCFEVSQTRLRREQFRSFLDFLIRVSQSLVDSFLQLGKLHWFPYLGQSDFYEPSVFTYRWSLKFVENVVLKREQWRLKCHFVPPTSVVYFIVWRMNLSKLSRNY